ncbi:MAG TPA: alpha/beta hydrolase domain-containing protein [Novosphingobium sp.]
MRRSTLLSGVSAVLLGLGAVAPAAFAAPADTTWRLPALPEVTPVPITAQSRPFLGAGADLDAAGYVEEEFFLTGQANTYEWDGTDGRVKVVAGPGKYVNRILVRRPKDPKRFSGNVEVNLLNATTMVDRGWPLDYERMVADGDAWVGITTKSLTAATLKQFDPQRYGPLDWSNPAPADKRCPEPSIIPLYTTGNISPRMMPAMMRDPAQEDGLVWDMIGQLGLLLKSDKRSAILPGSAKPKLFLTGISQSALMLNTWMAAFHNLYRTPDGKPVFDGYMPIVGANLLRIAQCSADVPVEDARNKAPLLDVPVIKIYSEAEMNYGRYTWRPDLIKARSGVVTYEIAGATHARGDIPGRPRKNLGAPSDVDVAKATVGLPQMPRIAPPGGQLPNDFAWAPTLRAALYNLEQWANKGVAPPQTPRIKLDTSLTIVRDADGNAQGGLRLPYIEVPIAHYMGALSQSGMASISGAKIPFDHARVQALYKDHADYVAKFSAATDAGVKARLIPASDAPDMKASADDAAVP